MGNKRNTSCPRRRTKHALAVKQQWKKRKAMQSLEQQFFQDNQHQFNHNMIEASNGIIGQEPKTFEDDVNDTLEIIYEKPVDHRDIIKGYRVVDLGYVLNWHSQIQSQHSKICTGGTMQLKEEIRTGLSSLLIFECNMCKRVVRKSTEESIEGKSLINTMAVWGTVTAGITFSAMKHTLNCMDVPFMAKNTYIKYEEKLENIWDKQLAEEITKAGKEEYELAEQKNPDGTANITVTVDGSWSKRSYGHSYNAQSGVAIIIGQATNKILFLGIRNKYCCICAIAENNNKEAGYHKCYRNWKDQPSSKMEADIIAEGFKKSIEMHKLKYTTFIADGDSSVFATLKREVTYKDEITKIECTNHIIKNYTSALYKIFRNTKLPIKSRSVLKSRLNRLTIDARCAIRYNGKEGNTETLKYDLENGPHHVFGDHRKCRDYFCTKKSKKEKNWIPDLTKDGVYELIMMAVERIIKKADRLYLEATSNRAELFMSLVTKYTCGKRLNLIQRGNYGRRCTVAGLQYQQGNMWHQEPFSKIFNVTPGEQFLKVIEKKNPTRKLVQRKTKFNRSKQEKPSPIDEGYGEHAEEHLPEEELQNRCNVYLKTMDVTEEMIKNIEEKSIGQHGNTIYDRERSNRLTASLFGKVCKRRAHTSCHNLVKECLHKNNLHNENILYGLKNERRIREMFADLHGKNVRPCGLFIDKSHNYLGASPDGFIEAENAIVEIKTFPGLRGKLIGDNLYVEAAKKVTGFCLAYKDGELKLKSNHNYYYQIQGQLHICNANKCYFIGYIGDNHPLHVEEIMRDDAFWESMEQKLTDFYKHCILPELVLQRIDKDLTCRDPPYILEAKKLALTKEKNNKRKRQSQQDVVVCTVAGVSP